MIDIKSAEDPDVLVVARELIRAHFNAHSTAHDPAQTDAFIASLPGQYAPPRGGLWVAFVEGRGVASAALQEHDAGIAEVKRMYVEPSYRGQGIARALIRYVIEQARERGYHTLRLGTLRSMKPAQSLYESEGFRAIPPYRPDEFGDTVFYELSLEDRPIAP